MKRNLLSTPKYGQPAVLRVTGLDPVVLQTWMNRDVLGLGKSKPGYGRRRLYSALDVVQLAVMRRMADLHIALRDSVEIAKLTRERLAKRDGIDWNFFIFLKMSGATAPELQVEILSSTPWAKYSPTHGDAYDMRLSHFIEPFEGTGLGNRRVKKPGSDEKPIDPKRREALARIGIHAEPIVVFPLGEIANGALAQLRAVDEQDAEADREALCQ